MAKVPLTPKVIINRRGQRQTVYVRPETSRQTTLPPSVVSTQVQVPARTYGLSPQELAKVQSYRTSRERDWEILVDPEQVLSSRRLGAKAAVNLATEEDRLGSKVEAIMKDLKKRR